MLGGDVGDVAGDGAQLIAAQIGLAHDALPRLGNVMLEAYHVLEAERFAELRRDLHRLVVDRVAPVETDQRRGAVITGEQFRADQRPQPGVGVVIAHEDRNLELDVHAQAVEQIAEQHRAGVDVQNLLDAVLGVVIEELVEPLERVLVGLPHPAEVTGDRLRAAQVDIGAVGAFGVQRLHVARADDVHRGGEGRQVAVGLLFLHLAHADEAPRHQRPLGNSARGGLDHPREILARTHFQRDGEIVGERHCIRLHAEDFAPVIGDADESMFVALRMQPFEIGQIFGPDGFDTLEQDRELARLRRFAVDLLRRPVFSDHREKIVDDAHIGVEENRVEVVEPFHRNLQQLS